MSVLLDWLDDRTGIRHLVHKSLYEPIPGGARWRYVWGSTLVFVFFVQVLSGFCLWTCYSPSTQNAWASVFYLDEFMVLGRMMRGLHHYAAQAMVVLLGIHFLQVVWDGAYRAPREFNFWLGMIMALIVLALALTGYLLPWDQKGYYATQVATKILGAIPWVGQHLQLLVQGGREYGQLTLTRFFALHAGLLPSMLVVLLVMHLALFRRHGITTREHPSAVKSSPPCLGVFWPDQVLRDAIACGVVLAILMYLTWYRPPELAAPADPSEPFAAARPEWYFLSLFQFLKFEAVEQMGLAFGAIVVPGALFGVLMLMPFIARIPGGHAFNVSFTVLLLVGLAGLTIMAWVEDLNDPSHQAAIRLSARDANRVRQLAKRETLVPVEGAQTLLREDPLTQGPRLFARHCASCHFYHGHNGLGEVAMILDPASHESVPARPTAADLGTLGTREWMRAVLVDFSNLFAPVKNADWYGKADGIDPEESEMADWSGDHASLMSPENAQDLAAVIEFLVSLSGRSDLKVDQDLARRGREVAVEGKWNGSLSGVSCTDCHESLSSTFDPQAEGNGYPDLAGYLSAAWLREFIAHPDKEQFYGDRNHMPAYADLLTEEELDLLVRWLVGDYYREPDADVAAPP